MRIYSFSEIKESRIMMDRKPPAFGVIITVITLVFVLGMILLAGFSTKTYVVKANGVVTSENKTYIMNGVSGAIKNINVKEGQSVEEGDILFEIDSFQVVLQITQMQSGLDYVAGKIELIERLMVFVNNYNLENPNRAINPFDSLIASETKQYGEAQQFIDYIEGQVKHAEESVGTPEEKEFTQRDVDSIKGQFLSQQYSDLQNYELQKLDKESRIKMYTDSLNEYQVKSQTSGVVHFNTQITLGMVLQAGSMIGSVSEQDESKLYFDTIVSAADISKIGVGDSVEIAVAGVMQNEFGIIKGKVELIDNDSTQTEKGEVFYKIRIKPVATVLKDKKGNIVNITNGMLAESRIKYDEATWLKWIIQQIGVKFR